MSPDLASILCMASSSCCATALRRTSIAMLDGVTMTPLESSSKKSSVFTPIVPRGHEDGVGDGSCHRTVQG